MRKIRHIAALLVLPALLVVIPSSAAAQPATTVTVTVSEYSELLDPTLVRVPITVACAPMTVRDVQSNSEMRQAVSDTQIAQGTGFLQNRQLVCDGEPHPNAVLIWANPTGPPFTRGTATILVPMFVCDPSFTCQSSNSTIQITTIRKPAAEG